jgi:hypothetical protein
MTTLRLIVNGRRIADVDLPAALAEVPPEDLSIVTLAFNDAIVATFTSRCQLVSETVRIAARPNDPSRRDR